MLSIVGSIMVIMKYGVHMALIVILILTVVGAFQIVSPELGWKVQHVFSFILYDSISPSEFGILMVKIGGYVMMVIASVCALVLATL